MRVCIGRVAWRPVFLLTLASSFLAAFGGVTPSRTVRTAGFSRLASGSGFRSGSSLSPCAHVGDATNAVSARAVMAGTVFEGKARSRNVAREPGGLYGVTFVVQRIHKDKSSSPLKRGSPVRLLFRDRKGLDTQGPCRQSYNFTRRPGDVVRTNIKRGGKYIVFVNGVGPHNFTTLGEPVFRSRKNLQAVKDVLCKNCLRPASISGLKDTKVKVKDRLRLVCRSKGNPLPAVSWYKDGNPVNASRASRIQFKKKRSSLVIPKVRVEDAGRYECRATSVNGAISSSWATVTVSAQPNNPPTDNTTTLWPLVGGVCPIEQYCLNGGTCTFYDTVGELVCQCAEGFKGQRCESKDVYNRSNSSPESWERGPPTRIMTFN
ncbi:protein vein isoform X2 [Cimex lectularius]|uniref:Protein vein n=1 Tax=Cimex lectularius TaxID=79782 RepID=A0A8I6RX48_CIMLE|nr:protein vein isoform X2 [Cimex lectularius]